MHFTSYHFLLTCGTTRKVLALVNKLLLCEKEGIAISSIRSYGHLQGIGVQKGATYFHPDCC